MMITGRFIIFFRSVVSGLLIMLRRSNAVAAMQSQQCYEDRNNMLLVFCC